jgi:predicted nucleic acid-binding protein
MIFCDTSAFAKLYVSEPESAALRRLTDAEDEVCASEIVRVELMSVFHRRWREGKWSQEDLLATVRQFENDCVAGVWTWLPLDTVIVDAASKTYLTLPKAVFLRSADCLHLVTAVHHRFTGIYTYDIHQTAAAATLGLKPLTA